MRIALAFEEFFEAERARLFRALLLVTHDAAESEDLMQEAFVRVWERWVDQKIELTEPNFVPIAPEEEGEAVHLLADVIRAVPGGHTTPHLLHARRSALPSWRGAPLPAEFQLSPPGPG